VTGKRILALVGVLLFGAAVGLTWLRRLPVVPPAPPAPTQPALKEPVPKAATEHEWRALLKANGLGRYVPALEKLVRPAVQLATRQVTAGFRLARLDE
jgi:hypothetical protein